MDIKLLTTFVDLVATRNFSKTAENLYITQAAVSQRIKLLEESLDTALFVRKHRNLMLSEAGHRLLPYAETITSDWAMARQTAALVVDVPLITVASTAGLWRYSIQDWFCQSTLLSENSINALSLSPVELGRQIFEDTIDLAITLEPNPNEDFTSRKIRQFKLGLLSSVPGQTFPGALESDYVVVDWGDSFMRFHLAKIKQTANTSTNLSSIAIALLRSRGGSAYLPLTLLDDANPDGFHVVDGAPLFSRWIYGVFRKSHRYAHALNGLCDALRQHDKPTE